MPHPERPCPPDCERRSVRCHTGCAEYAAFARKLEERRGERERARVQSDYNDALALKLARYRRHHGK